MNTPKSKSPKRHVPKKFRESGNYSWGIQDKAIATALGHLIAKWTHVEHMMIDIFMELTTIQDLGVAQITFRSIFAQALRKKIMVALLERAEIHKSKSALFDDLIEEF